MREEAQTTVAQTAVAEPVEEKVRRHKADRREKPKRQPRYNVILWDDQSHTHAYVMLMLQQLFGHAPTKGFQLADEVDRRGRAIVLTTTREHAELKRDQIRAFGKDGLLAESSGSMYASIEPCE
jgi:ATP-dependent Clp protease adaptor protein ClpS